MKKNKRTFSKETPTLDDSNKLKTSAVDRLVEAAQGDATGVDEEEVKNTKKNKLPVWLKALFIKWWMVAAACFFFYWGLGNYISTEWEKVIVLGLATGGVNDLLTNNFFRLLETSEHEYNKYMLLTQKNKIWTLLVMVFYSLILTLIIVKFYDLINLWIINANPSKYDIHDVPFGVEPISYGLIYLAFDMVVICIKDLIVMLINKNKNQEVQ